MKRTILALATVFIAPLASAAVMSEVIGYKHGNVKLEGYLAYDDGVTGKRPAVLVVHEWLGHNDYARKRADQLAELGYVAFALDMYGKGVTAKNTEEAGKMSGVFKADRQLMRGRALKGLEVLQNHRLADGNLVAAIGYCFGGTVALELARAGAPLKGVVSFHGGLSTPNPGDAKNIKGKVLVLHGADDPYVPEAEVTAFEDEMRKGGVDWQLNAYGGAVHGFTNPNNSSDASKGAAYNEKADRRSWEAMKVFFKEIFR